MRSLKVASSPAAPFIILLPHLLALLLPLLSCLRAASCQAGTTVGDDPDPGGSDDEFLAEDVFRL